MAKTLMRGLLGVANDVGRINRDLDADDAALLVEGDLADLANASDEAIIGAPPR